MHAACNATSSDDAATCVETDERAAAFLARTVRSPLMTDLLDHARFQ